jgi:Flp pilus assembly protein TadD
VLPDTRYNPGELPMTRKLLLLLSLGAALLAAVVVAVLLRPAPKPPAAVAPPSAPLPPTAASYVGAETCKGCHAREYQDWWGSHHQLAMQQAGEQTVLGDFRDASVTHFGLTSKFFRKDGKFFVHTDGPDGTLRDYEVRYTFGVYPLQQYLVAFPDGRLQALPLAWDARAKDRGGQRWFHLYPKDKIRAGDELHWTGLQQNWNFMCAECHSTDLRKNYDEAANTFHTTWKDIDVGCEACHGRGSGHVKWAAQQNRPTGSTAATGDDGLQAHFDDRRGVTWILDPATGNSHRSRPRANTDELEMCGRCHARAAKISEDWTPGKPLLDTHRVTLLEEGMYTADGQMQDEVYNHGSFLQSKMFAAGVTCSDCHDAHSGKLRATDQEVCGSCHSLSKYASTQHHHHTEHTAESRCAACHMPLRTYMVVDQRHDHSFRIPRPDESVKYGTPNACNDCHKDKPASWTAAAIERWYGGVHPGYQRFTAALVAARRQLFTAQSDLIELTRDSATPGIVRATALTELGGYLDPNTVSTAQEGLQSTDALVRLAAVELLSGTDPATRWGRLAPLLQDPVRAVRIATADALADALPGDVTPESRRAFDQALAEYQATQKLNADRPEAHLSLGNLYARQRRAQEAEAEYRQALKLWPGFVPAYVNLADLSRARHQDEEAEHWLMEASKVAPNDAGVLFSLGLLRVRQHRTPEALQLLARAAKLAPDNAHYAYVYAVGLYSNGKTAEGLANLRAAQAKFPGNREVLLGLASLTAESGDPEAARRYAESFVAMAPADPRGPQLLEQLMSPSSASEN